MANRKKRICILYTGGTIGMVPTDKGYAPKKDYFAGLLSEVSQLYHKNMPDWEVVEFNPLLDSSNIAMPQWNYIGREIAARYDLYDGFVVLHGTDTMAYSASALSFMLKGLTKPVVFTGSQIPLCQLRSDGLDNLINSIVIAGEGIAKQVCIYFAGKLLRANRAIKFSADELMAFDSPNYPLLANVGIDIKYNKAALAMPPHEGVLEVTLLKDIPITVLKIFPGICLDIFEPVFSSALKGIVLETFGGGNIPSNNASLIESIKKATSSGSIVAVCSQCYQGTANPGAYEAGSVLKESGAVSCYDMTTEAVITKLYYLLSCDYGDEEIKKLMTENLRGEISLY